MIRVCPKRDAVCPHGMGCPYVVDRYTCRDENEALAKADAILLEGKDMASVAGVQTSADALTETQHPAGPFSFEAQLAERLRDPEWLAKWNAAEEERAPFVALLHDLRGEEGASVTLLCDNPDFNGQPNNAIEVCGSWTGWQDRRFSGDTLHAALLAAFRAKKSSEVQPVSPSAASAGKETRDEPPSFPRAQEHAPTPSPAGWRTDLGAVPTSRYVLVYSPTNGVDTSSKDEHGVWWGIGEEDPTHWQPFPPPPTPSADDGECSSVADSGSAPACGAATSAHSQSEGGEP